MTSKFRQNSDAFRSRGIDTALNKLHWLSLGSRNVRAVEGDVI